MSSKKTDFEAVKTAAKKKTGNKIPKVVILGGGFGGAELVRRLKNKNFETVLIDKKNFHTFQPLLYQVATAGLEPDSIASSFRAIFRNQKNLHFRLANILEICPEACSVKTDQGVLEYDFLVIATGSKPNYFGLSDVEKNAIPLKEISNAMDMRKMLFGNLEYALWHRGDDSAGSMDIAVIGAGPTGVELAGTLAELRSHIFARDYPGIDVNEINIYLIDMAGRVLPSMSEKSSEYVRKYFDKQNVKIILNAKVSSFDGDTLVLEKNRKIRVKNVIWTAGVTGNIPPGISPASIEKGRLLVDDFNQVKDCENIFALGDAAYIKTRDNPSGHPMLAPVAIQQARNLACNLERRQKSKPLLPFHYKNYGVMATVGRNHAVVELPFAKFYGFPAWVTWLFVHLMALVGFRNKLIALINWIWNYVFYDRSLRLVLDSKDTLSDQNKN